MNNMSYPYFPGPFNGFPHQINIEDELNSLKTEISKINERLNNIENQKKNNYLKKDDSLYML